MTHFFKQILGYFIVIYSIPKNGLQKRNNAQ